MVNEAGVEAIRENMVLNQRKLYKDTEGSVGLRWKYKENRGITEVNILHKHYLIACRIYEESWLSYVTWWEQGANKEPQEKVAMEQSIFKRACLGNLCSKLSPLKLWAIELFNIKLSRMGIEAFTTSKSKLREFGLREDERSPPH